MAITIDTFRILISEGQELLRDIDLYDRQFEFEGSGRYVLTGVRQAGKSYMLFKRARQLMSKGHSPEEFIYIDFDDERLIGMDAGDFDTILQAYRSTGGQKPILMFDEIQNIDGWEHFARRLANRKYQVYITGSNAKMLSRNIHTTLRGRYTEGTVYPYSFSEYLESQGIVPAPGWEYSSERFKVMEMLSQYLLWGGFPELMLFKNKRRWLNDLYEKILLNDIVVRGRIRNETALRMVFKRLAESIGKPIAYNRIANLIKSTGINTTPASVIQYVEAAKDAYIILPIENYATKFTERETVKKHYFIDNGLLSIFLSNTAAPLFENLCAVHLYRTYGDKLYFYHKNTEVDFYIPEAGYAVQACVTLSDPDTKERKVNALVRLDRAESLSRMVIVTRDEEGSIPLPDGRAIEILPVWKWLLQVCPTSENVPV